MNVGDTVAIIAPQAHPLFGKKGNIIEHNQNAKSELCYLVEFENKRKNWFGETEMKACEKPASSRW